MAKRKTARKITKATPKVTKAQKPSKTKVAKPASRTSRAKTKVKAVAKSTQVRAIKEIKKAKVKFDEQEKKAKEYVKKNPEKSLAIAAGIGAAIGAVAAILGRKRKR